MADDSNTASAASTSRAASPGLLALMTRERWVEVGRIVLTGLVAGLYWQGLVPVEVLWAGVAVGLYPLVKTGRSPRPLPACTVSRRG